MRHYAALAAIEWLLTNTENASRDIEHNEHLKRCWLYGFFVRCCEETPAE